MFLSNSWGVGELVPPGEAAESWVRRRQEAQADDAQREGTRIILRAVCVPLRGGEGQVVHARRRSEELL
jgi:hypothetical protein